MKRPAVFFDRDNTLIKDPGYIDDPDKVSLFDDTAGALRRLGEGGYLLVVVTNQSGVARGIITEQRLAEIHQRLQELLAGHSACIDAVYSSPYLDGPEATVERYRRASDLRKPSPGMLLRAAADLGIDLPRSWMIGNSGRDIEAGRRAGCRTILLDRGGENAPGHQANPDHVARSLHEAANLVLRAGREAPAARASAASNPGEAAPDSSGRSSSVDTVRLLSEIRDLLDRSARRRRQRDFSLLRLAATLMQMLAVVVVLWGLAALMTGAADSATARFTLAIFLQLATLCTFLADRHE